jgi:hypothetical protein
VCAAHGENKHSSTTPLAFACNKREARDDFWRGDSLADPGDAMAGLLGFPRVAKGGVRVGGEFGEGALQVSG